MNVKKKWAGDPSVAFSAAKRLKAAIAQFESETGLSNSKAAEVYVAEIVNRWLMQHNYDWKIQVSSKPRGIDGTLTGARAGDVEFKTSKAYEFQFKPDFPFAAHACIVLAELNKQRMAKRIFLAFGKQAMDRLKAMLDADADRPSFKPSEHNLRIFSKGKDATESGWRKPVDGLEKAAAEAWSTDDRIVEIGLAEIEKLDSVAV